MPKRHIRLNSVAISTKTPIKIEIKRKKSPKYDNATYIKPISIYFQTIIRGI